MSNHLTIEPPYVVIHYAEIGLKGRNRSFFEKQLVTNVRDRLAAENVPIAGIDRLSGRLLVRLEAEATADAVVERLRTVPGIAYLAPAYSATKDLRELTSILLAVLGPAGPAGRNPRSFKVETHRTDKQFPLTSPQVNAEIGDHVQQATGWPVNLRQPELVIHIEILYTQVLFYLDRVDGVGGLPVGSSGTVGLLLSGGIDSPVAGFYALKRGCHVVPVHFHSAPFGNWLSSENKIRRLVTVLRVYGLLQRYYVVPIGELQQQIAVETPAALRVLLYRRFMIRIAQELMRREGGLALITGESLGQVASQTLHSLHVVEDVATMPVLRPLVGLDKTEIIVKAQALGTYDISIEPSDDCCQFLLPRQVSIRPTVAELEEAEANLDVSQLVAAALAAARLERAES